MKRLLLFTLTLFIAIPAHFAKSQDMLTLKNGKELPVKVLEISPQEIKYKRFDNPNGPLVTILKSDALRIRYQNGTTETFEAVAPQMRTTNIAASISNANESQGYPSPRKAFAVGDNADVIYFDETYTAKIIEINDRKEKATLVFNKYGKKIKVYRRLGELIAVQNNAQGYALSQPTETQSTPKQGIQAPNVTPYPSPTDMFQYGKDDAMRNYRGYKGAGAGTFLTTFFLGPIVGLIPAVACSSTAPTTYNLNYPSEQLAQQSDYRRGYTQEASHIKSKKVWGNFGLGFGSSLVVALVILSAAHR